MNIFICLFCTHVYYVTALRNPGWIVWFSRRHVPPFGLCGQNPVTCAGVLWTDGPGLCNLCIWFVFPAGCTGVRYSFVACYVAPGCFLLLVLLVNTWLSSQFKKKNKKQDNINTFPVCPRTHVACQNHKHADSGAQTRWRTCVLMRRQQRLLSDDYEGEDVLIWSLLFHGNIISLFWCSYTFARHRQGRRLQSEVCYLFCKRRDRWGVC